MSKVKATIGEFIALNETLNKIRSKGLSYNDVRTWIANKKQLSELLTVDLQTIEDKRKQFFDKYRGKLNGIHGVPLKDIAQDKLDIHYSWLEDQRELEYELKEALKKEVEITYKKQISFETFSTCVIDGTDTSILEALSANQLSLIIDLFCSDT